MTMQKLLVLATLLSTQHNYCYFYIIFHGDEAQAAIEKSKKENKSLLTYKTESYSEYTPILFLIDKNYIKGFEKYNEFVQANTLLRFSTYDSLNKKVTYIKINNSKEVQITEDHVYIFKFNEQFKGWYLLGQEKYLPNKKLNHQTITFNAKK